MTQLLKQTVESISESIRFDSSLTPPLADMPFGKGAADCLKHFLDTANALGFETHNYENYAGEVIFGTGEPFAVLAHLDVVPAGSGWSRDPFGGEVEDGKIWGRGAIDMLNLTASMAVDSCVSVEPKPHPPREPIGRLVLPFAESSSAGCTECLSVPALSSSSRPVEEAITSAV